MADIKISSATNAGIVLGTDKIPIARSGSVAAYFATAAEIKSYTGGGGGGGSYTAGNGLYFSGTSPTTIGNTGTIVQPAATGANPGLGIFLSAGAGASGDSSRGGGVFIYAGGISNPGTYGGGAYGGSFTQYAGGATATDAAGKAIGGGFILQSGGGRYSTIGSTGGGIIAGGGQVDASTGAAIGATVQVYGGNALSGSTNTAGNVELLPGAGDANGVIIMSRVGNSDPHILGAVWTLDTITGAAAISQG